MYFVLSLKESYYNKVSKRKAIWTNKWLLENKHQLQTYTHSVVIVLCLWYTPDHLTCCLRNLYAGQKAAVRIIHGKMNWFKIGKEVTQGCILSSCLFNLYSEYIMWNAGLNEAQAGIKISRRNINNLRYADDNTLRQKVKRN